jgi:hypothetical protein
MSCGEENFEFSDPLQKENSVTYFYCTITERCYGSITHTDLNHDERGVQAGQAVNRPSSIPIPSRLRFLRSIEVYILGTRTLNGDSIPFSQYAAVLVLVLRVYFIGQIWCRE